jgi:16S rRNA G1207 methylase RsmC
MDEIIDNQSSEIARLRDVNTRLRAQLATAKKALEEANHITYISEKAGGLNGWIFVAGHMRKIIRAALKELEADE